MHLLRSHDAYWLRGVLRDVADVRGLQFVCRGCVETRNTTGKVYTNGRIPFTIYDIDLLHNELWADKPGNEIQANQAIDEVSSYT